MSIVIISNYSCLVLSSPDLAPIHGFPYMKSCFLLFPLRELEREALVESTFFTIPTTATPSRNQFQGHFPKSVSNLVRVHRKVTSFPYRGRIFDPSPCNPMYVLIVLTCKEAAYLEYQGGSDPGYSRSIG